MTNQASLTIDMSEVEGGMNVIYSLARAVGSKRVRDAAVNRLSKTGEDLFGLHADLHAGSTTDNLEHMYEWGRAGDRRSRLFQLDWRTQGHGRLGTIRFKDASEQIPVPISRAHELEAHDKGLVLSRFVWKNKAEPLESQSTFVITPMGDARERDGWIRRWPSPFAPARRLMAEIGGRIRYVNKYAHTYPYQGKFTEFFNQFWDENNFRPLVFDEFRKNYERAVYRTFVRAINMQRITMPARIPTPGIHIVSRGRRIGANVGGRPMPGMIREYERRIIRSMR